MRSTFSLLLYINRNKVRVDGTTSVLCRISIDGKSTTITTGISCNPKQWNAKTAETAEVWTNNRLKEFRKHAEQLYDEMLKEQGVVSAELLKNKIAGHVIVPTHLLQIGERERERLAVRSKEIDSTFDLQEFSVITRVISVSSWTRKARRTLPFRTSPRNSDRNIRST